MFADVFENFGSMCLEIYKLDLVKFLSVPGLAWYAVLNIVTRNNIVWKLMHSYCLCYCQTFLLVPDSADYTKCFLRKCAVHYLCHIKSNNIVGQRKTTNTEKHFYP